jgi:hypothetical protein
MKILVVFSVFCLSLPLVHADEQDLAEQQIELELLDKYDWLYKILIPENDRERRPDRAKRSFVVHLKDSKKVFPRPEKLKAENLSGELPYLAKGKITYKGFFPGHYSYDLEQDKSGTLHITVRVHFKTKGKINTDRMKVKVQRAEDYWNREKLDLDFNYKFHFQVVENSKKAHFSVKLKQEYSRGPYFSKWSMKWNEYVVAHELGHMMGLGDEYKEKEGSKVCLSHSLMCSNSSWSKTMTQHHYHILRRALKVNSL